MLWVVVGKRESGKTTLLKKLQESSNTMTFDCNTKGEVNKAIECIDNETMPMDFFIAISDVSMLPRRFYRSHQIINLKNSNTDRHYEEPGVL